VDGVLSARFGQGATLSGGFSTGRTANYCVVVDAPVQFCNNVPPFLTQVKLNGSYPLPWWGLISSATYQNLPGSPISISYVPTNAEIAPSLGRNLAACRGAAVCNANVTIPIIPPQSMFEPRQQQLDLRFSRLFRLPGTHRLRGNLDIYNVFNASDVLAMGTTYGPAWQNVNSILTGRMLRVGAQYDF
jgi:hypothetical protein